MHGHFSSFFSNSCCHLILIITMSAASAATMGKLSGKVALITGCCSGGISIAFNFPPSPFSHFQGPAPELGLQLPSCFPHWVQTWPLGRRMETKMSKHLEFLILESILNVSKTSSHSFLAAGMSTTSKRRRNNARLPKRERGKRSRFLCKVFAQRDYVAFALI